MDEALIRYKNVYINQQELGVLEDVNLELNKGEFVYLIGKVGSGKTSLLKTIYGELDIQSGEAEVLGYNMTNIKRKHIPELRRRSRFSVTDRPHRTRKPQFCIARHRMDKQSNHQSTH